MTFDDTKGRAARQMMEAPAQYRSAAEVDADLAVMEKRGLIRRVPGSDPANPRWEVTEAGWALKGRLEGEAPHRD
jgi:DNA-binding HxlR family transcriptional regulator